jgi:hypothetical protein
MRDFKWEEILEALRIVISKGRGFKQDLLKTFENQLPYIKTTTDAENLFEMLELLGYVSNGVNKKGQSTWKATRRAYKEVLPFWKLLIKTIFN